MPKSIVLIFPQCNVKVFGGNNDSAQKEKAVAPPLGILYLATELLEAGYNVQCCDYNAEPYALELLKKTISGADLVGVSILSFNREDSYALIRAINRLRPELPVIAGGADCILHPSPVPGAVLTVVEEAEAIIADVVTAVLEKQNFGTLCGVVFTDKAGAIQHGRPYSRDGLSYYQDRLCNDLSIKQVPYLKDGTDSF